MPKTKKRRKPPPLPHWESDEPIILRIHRHWYALAKSSLPFFVFLAGLVLALAIAPARDFLLEKLLPLVLVLAILPLLGILWRTLEWVRCIYLLTPRRLIRLERSPLFYERRQEIPLGQVMNVAILPNNPLDSVLDFDDLVIELYQGEPIVLAMVPEPERMRSLILGQVSQRRAVERRESQRWLGRELKEAIGTRSEQSVEGWIPILQEEGLTAFPKRDVKLWRRHWVVFLRASAVSIFLLLVVLYLWLAPALSLPPLHRTGWRAPHWALGGAAAFLVAWISWRGLLWWGENYGLTSSHLLEIRRELSGRWRTLAAFSLGDIQNISYLIPGPLAWLLGYGEIHIELAHPKGPRVLKFIPRPQAFQQLLFQRMREFQGAAARHRRREQKEEVLGWLEAAEDRPD